MVLGGVDAIEIDHKTLGQFTGLTDKNGIDIYEGDIVTAYLDVAPSYNNPDDCIHMIQGIVSFDYGSFLLGGYSFCGDSIYDFEVIGNVHENPELL